MNTGYMGQMTVRDEELVSLLIKEPYLSLDELGDRLGITKQAVAERKSKLEEQGFTKTFYFWNITPRFECTKRIFVKVTHNLSVVQHVMQILDQFNPITVFFKIKPEEFYDGKVASLSETINEVEGILILNSDKEEKNLRSKLKSLSVAQITIEPVLFSRLLGEVCDIEVRTTEAVKRIASTIARQLSKEISVQAVLCEELSTPTDQIDLLVIREKRFQPDVGSYERRVEGILIDYHFMNLQQLLKSRNEELAGMRIIYARDETVHRRIRSKLENMKDVD